MSKYLAVVLLLFVLLIPIRTFAAAGDAGAACGAGGTTGTGLCNPFASNTDKGAPAISNFAQFAVFVAALFGNIAGIVAIVFVTFSGFRFIISQGNAKDVETARQGLQWTLSGLVVVLLSYITVSALSTVLHFKPPGSANQDKPYNPLGSTTGKPIFPNGINDFNDVYRTLLQAFFEIMGLVAILMIIIGGYKYITARGDTEQVESAKGTLQYALLGVVISLLGYVIVHATAAFFGAK